MLNEEYMILSLPTYDKHYILRTNTDQNAEVLLKIDDLKITATISAICDSHRESMIVVNNLIGE